MQRQFFTLLQVNPENLINYHLSFLVSINSTFTWCLKINPLNMPWVPATPSSTPAGHLLFYAMTQAAPFANIHLPKAHLFFRVWVYSFQDASTTIWPEVTELEYAWICIFKKLEGSPHFETSPSSHKDLLAVITLRFSLNLKIYQSSVFSVLFVLPLYQD